MTKNCLGFLLVVLLCVTSQNSFANISYLDLKGSSKLITDEYSYLAPHHGLTLIETGTMANLRFLRNFGPEKTSIECLRKPPKTHAEFIKNNDCPQDNTARLIQLIFPSLDRKTLVENQYDDHPEVRLLNGRAIGGAIAFLKSKTKEDLIANKRERIAELASLLFEAESPERFHNWKVSSLSEKKKEIQSTKAKIKTCRISSDLDVLVARLEELQIEVSIIGSRFEGKKTIALAKSSSPQGKFEDFKYLAEALVEAYIDQLEGSEYPPHTVENTLLALLWKKTDSSIGKTELSDYIQALGPPIVHLEGEWQREFEEQKFSIEDLRRLIMPAAKKQSEMGVDFHSPGQDNAALLKVIASEELISQLKSEEGFTVSYLAYRDFLRHRAPIIPYSSSAHSSEPEKPFPDCGEAASRNFMNMLLYNHNTFSFDVEQLNRAPFKLHPRFLEYFRKYPNVLDIDNEPQRNAWSEVVSEIPGITYVKGRYELSPGPKNMVTVLEYLLYSKVTEESKTVLERFEKILSDRESPLDSETTHEEREHGKIAGVKNYKSSITLLSGDLENQNAETKIMINYGTNPFTFSFNSGHFHFDSNDNSALIKEDIEKTFRKKK